MAKQKPAVYAPGQPNYKPQPVQTGAWGGGSNSQSGSMNGGANAKGSSTKYKGPSGFFQYGTQYGFMNPQGKMKFGTKKPGPKWGGTMVPFGSVISRASESGQALPAYQTAKPKFLDPYYLQDYAGLRDEYAREQAERLHSLSSMRGALKTGRRELDQSRTGAVEDTVSGLGAAGLTDSGIASRSMAQIQDQYRNRLADLLRETGPKAQSLEKTMLALAAKGFREKESAAALAAKDRYQYRDPSIAPVVPAAKKAQKKKGKKNG